MQRSQVQDKAPCPDVVTLPQDIDRDINYAANQVIYTFGTDVHCGVQMQLHAPNIQVFDTLLLAKENCTAPLVQAYPGPCPELKYTEGFSQQSTAQYTYDTGGNLTYDPNKKLTFYYNHHNLPYRIVGAENDELQLLYAADGSLLQRKYIKNNDEVSKTDYLRGKELKNGLMESVYHNDGRVIKSGALWKYEYQIKDHLGNVRVTFTDDNNDGITERKSINDYYSYGMEWNNKWELGDTLSPENKYRYNGKEYVEEMGWDNLMYGARNMMPDIGRFSSIDRFSAKYSFQSGYSYGAGNPIKYIDVNGDSIAIKVDKNNVAFYHDGKLYNRNGSNYSGKGAKIKKDGTVKLSGFLKKTVNSLNNIRLGGKAGEKLIQNIQNHKGIVTIKESVNNANIGGMIYFNPDSNISGLDQNGNQSRPAFVGLAHELAHFQDWIDDGSVDKSIWIKYSSGNTSSNAEKFASHIENMVRAENNIPLREFYGIDNGKGVGRLLISGTNFSSNQTLQFGKFNIPYKYK